MTHKVFRPFWSYDVEETEKWLSLMATEGYLLVGLNMNTRQFFFEKSHPKNATYQIEYNKALIHYPTASLEEDGWIKVLERGKWLFLRNDKPTTEINKYPVHDGVLSRNRKLMYVFGGLLLYMILSSILPLFIIVWTLLSEATGTIEESPFWILTITIGIFMWTIVPYSTYKLYKSNKRLLEPNTHQKSSENLTRTNEEAIESSKEVVKWRMGWQYSPDKLEGWLEEMEKKGYHLYRVSMFGNRYHFVKGSSKKVTYCVDYQNVQSQGYFDMHREAGWELMFTTASSLSKWSIWSKEYEEIPPQFYSDREQKLKHARRVAITYLSIFGSLAIMYIALIVSEVGIVRRDGMDPISWMMFIVFGIVLIEFATIVIKSVNYYRRVRQNVQLH